MKGFIETCNKEWIGLGAIRRVRVVKMEKGGWKVVACVGGDEVDVMVCKDEKVARGCARVICELCVGRNLIGHDKLKQLAEVNV